MHISLHNLLHIHEDIINFSASDNYWCAVFERAFKHYFKKSRNCKGIERTFASSEARREFLKSLGGTEVATELGKHDVKQVRFSVIVLNLLHLIYFNPAVGNRMEFGCLCLV